MQVEQRLSCVVEWLVALVALTAQVLAQAPSPTSTQPAEDGSSIAEASNDPETMFPHLADTRYWLSGQANFIFQMHPSFHAPYSGRNSLNPNYEKATSRLLTPACD